MTPPAPWRVEDEAEVTEAFLSASVTCCRDNE